MCKSVIAYKKIKEPDLGGDKGCKNISSFGKFLLRIKIFE